MFKVSANLRDGASLDAIKPKAFPVYRDAVKAAEKLQKLADECGLPFVFFAEPTRTANSHDDSAVRS